MSDRDSLLCLGVSVLVALDAPGLDQVTACLLSDAMEVVHGNGIERDHAQQPGESA